MKKGEATADERLATLSPAKKKLFAKLLRERREPEPVASPEPILPRSTGAGPVPLSFSQERLWFLDQLEPGNPAYNVFMTVRLRGRPRVAALLAALREVVRRHESLRTTFEPREGRPVQVVRAEMAIPARQIDLASLPARHREAEAEHLAVLHARRPFDLARGPLLRVAVLRCGAREHRLSLSMHHIISDAWSLSVLLRELLTLYSAMTGGEPSPLRELALQFGDFAVWQRGWLRGDELDRQLAYWRRALSGIAQEPLPLPTDRPRPARQSFRGALTSTSLSMPVVRGLRSLARGEQTSLFVVLLTAFQVYLHRFTGSRVVAVGTPIANRNRVETEGLIGFFVNTLVLGAEVRRRESFRKHLDRGRETALGAYAHQDLPFEVLVRELQPRRDLSRSPLFQVQFTFRNTPKVEASLPGLEIEPVPVDQRTAQFDLTLSMSEEEGGLPIDLQFNRDLFDNTTARRLADQLMRLMAEAAAHPDVAVEDLALLSPAERQQLVGEWNDTAAHLADAELTLIRLIEAEAARTPGAVAVSWDGGRLTYHELLCGAGALARRLRERGVGPESRVGIAAERSPELVIGLLAILQAGAAYVPLDPDYPRERLAFMIEDSAVPVLLAQPHLVEALPAGSAEVVPLEGVAGGGEPVGEVLAAGAEVPGDALAYVIYTSGSTGRPKGAMNTHRAIVNRLLWMRAAYGIGAEDRVLQKTPVSFDVSVWELFLPLLAGARLVLARPGGHLDPSYLADLIEREGVTTVHFVPAMLQAFLEQDRFERCRSLRRVIASGEALPAALKERFFARLGCELHNLYGPTEAAIDVTAWACEATSRRSAVPIGRPISNLRALVLDRCLRPVPIGVAGELYLGGVGLARGYWRRPGLTAERFVPDPFAAGGSEPGARLYVTGDLVRARPGGEIEFLGRIDHQVKLRGFRIELGEIEASLAHHPAVREVVVVIRDAGAAGARLVAYIVAEEGSEPTSDELRRFLGDRLPGYMVPTAFVPLTRMPLTPNGKVDRRALPEPSPEARGGVPSVEPRSAAERALAAIWRAVLGVEEVGVEDNFFDLGGHSLLVVEVQSRLRRELGHTLSVVELFEHPTIASLAAFLAGTGVAPSAAPAVRLGQAESEIAVLAAAGRFPGARNVEEFWRNLRRGVESIRFLDREASLAAGVSPELVDDPRWVPAWGAIEDIDRFDAAFFGFSPREAEILDPQQRLFLETAWEALESAGYDPRSYPHRIGVYAGAGLSSYALHNLAANPRLLHEIGPFQAWLGNDKDYLATRTSYCLNLRGPSLSVQTACSTSLVAVSLACQALLDGKCEMALAGGVHVSVQQAGYLYQEGHILSPDGHCRAFAAEAGGTVPGSGVGIVVLKPLSAAIADGDPILGVIKGSAVNNDGSLKVGYTAPSVRGQAEVIAEALAAAGVDPLSIGYLEAHGTGTSVGDPIEIAGAGRAFRAAGDGEGSAACAIGSVKSNLGHLDAAAGVAGLIKALFTVGSGEIPPSIHFDRPNPEIDFAGSPFYVPRELAPWPEGAAPRRAGVSSFGIGGTNAHVVLEQAPPQEEGGPSRRCQLYALSARTETALAAASERLATHLETAPALAPADVAFTLAVGRHPFRYRRAVVAEDTASLAEALRRSGPSGPGVGAATGGVRRVAFLFPGQGSQHPGMLRMLHAEEPVFRAELEAITERISRHLVDPRSGEPVALLPLLLQEEGSGPAASRVGETWLTQPALFAVELALARLWMSWGIRPWAMLGHSLGEYVAACLAGVLELEDAAAMVAVRGRLMQAQPPGGMLSVALSADEVEPLLGDDLALAADNAPRLAVVAGAEPAIERLAGELSRRGVDHRRLRTSHAFHSPLMDAALEPFREWVATVSLRPPSLPFVSNLTGTWIRDEEATDPAYWAAHLRSPVRFAAGAATLLGDPESALLEVGPGRTLTTLARQRPEAAGRLVVASLPRSGRGRGDLESILDALGRLWSAGAGVDWQGYFAGQHRRRVRLPTYPFERRSYWIGGEPGVGHRREEDTGGEPGGVFGRHERPDLDTVHVAPRSDVERTLAEIWAGLLGIAEVGVDDDFFELGGHSLLATRVLARVRERLGVELPLRALFDSPTIARLAVAVDGLRRETGGPGGAPPLRPVPRGRPLRLSFAQQRLWFLHRLDPWNDAYHVPLAARLRGRLSWPALAASLSSVVRRHEVLRTVFEEVDGEPLQVVQPFARPCWPTVDLSALPPDRREAERRELAAAQLGRPFDLQRGPLFRAAVYRLAPREHVVVLGFHHVVTDGWSMDVLVQEIGSTYESLVAGLPCPLPELSIQYADFAEWQRRWLAGATLDAQIAFWRRLLGVDPPPLELPTDRPRRADRSWRGAVHRFRLDQRLVDRVRSFSQESRATLFMVLLAAFDALLHRYAGQERILVGTPIANRVHAALEPLIGFFVNTLVVPGDCSGDPPFSVLVDRVREASLAAQTYQDLPFERLVEELETDRDLTRTPLFQVLMVLQNAPRTGLELPGLTLSRLREGTRAAQFDLSLELHEGDADLVASLEYALDLFDGATVERLAGCYVRLLSGALLEPGRRIWDLPLLGEEEERQVLGVGEQSLELAFRGGVHERLRAWVERTPESVALVDGEEQLSYGGLWERALRLAARLQGLGVGRESRVAICLERSSAQVVAIVGVLAAGGCYVPLDPRHPDERLRYQLSDSGAVALVAGRELGERLSGARVARVDPEVAGEVGRRFEEVRPVWGEQAAYVIYTSGSTGRPKGVVVSHGNLSRLFDATEGEYGFGRRDVWTLFHSYAFDFSVWEIWGALLYGGRLVVVPYLTSRSPESVLGLLERERVTVLNQTPSAFRQLQAAEEARSGSSELSLRYVVFGGEGLEVRQLGPWWSRHGEAAPRLVNMYGITETTVHVTVREVGPSDVRPWVGSPVGEAIADLRVVLLDRRGRPVPVGVPGEICVGGGGVARGYEGRARRTAERFVPDPWGREGQRLYRSGDLACFRSDGELEYLGRIDQQVKLRGFRIELGEIESALVAEAGVSEAVAVVREEAGGDRRLVAYVVGRSGGPAPAPSALREALSRRLPEPMVPSAVVVLEALPLTVNGKLDRGALPAPAEDRRDLARPLERPRTEVERRLAAIFAELLGVSEVGVEDGFFELGGHSLLATRVVSRVSRALGVEVPVRALFEAPTVAGLAAALRQAGRADVALPPLAPVGRERPLPLSFAQERLWFLDRMEPGSAAYNIPLAWRLAGRLSTAALAQALAAVVSRHEVLRTRFTLVEGQPRQVAEASVGGLLSAVDLRGLSAVDREAELRRLSSAEARRPFDLGRAPLLRAAGVRLGEAEQALLATVHHIAADAWSLGLLARELAVCYEAFRAGRPVSGGALPALAVQYADFAVWQRGWLRGEVLAAEVGWWRGRLAGLPPVLEVPADRPRPPVQSLRGASAQRRVAGEAAGELLALGRRQDASPFMTLLALFGVLLARYTGERRLVVGSPVAGRTQPEVEPLLGFFVNTLALPLEVEAGRSFRQVVVSVRASVLAAQAHQEVPFEKLVEELAPERSAAHGPLVQVAFAWGAAVEQEPELSGLSLAPLAVETGTSKFDLALMAGEQRDGLSLTAEYAAELFDAATVERLLGHLGRLLEAVVSSPETAVDALALLGPEERRELLVERNATASGRTAGAPVHRRIAAWAEAEPARPAIEGAGEVLSYGELERRANRLARRLVERGLVAETRVALLTGRRPEMVVATLAVLKAGGAFVPLDPGYPRERLAAILEEAGVAVVLATEELTGLLPPAAPVLVVGGEDEEEADEPTDPGVTVQAASLAYVIYTSGSSGRPKGVAIPHGGLSHLVAWHLAAYRLGPEDRVSQVASPGFDASVWEIFPALAAGACLSIVPEEARRSPAELVRHLARARISAAFLPTPLAEAVLAVRWPRQAPLRLLLTGGEALAGRPAAGRPFTLVNHYGPTEATVVATAGVVAASGRRQPPIGRPIDDTRTYVVDGALEPVPVGVPGELCLGGAGLARGYLGRPARTAAAFLPDPFGGERGGRLYRTGDVVRWLPEGELEFLGRADRQVKLRGFRIELGDIEAALAAQPAVREAVVGLRPDGPGGDALVAYLVPANPGELDLRALRRTLEDRLPAYMVPAAFLTLPELPLTPHGKVDRRALAPPGNGTIAVVGGLPPRDAIELALAQVWAEVLGLGVVGVSDSFFELGGHSLVAVQLLERVRARLGCELPLSSLFTADTVAAQADLVRRAAASTLEARSLVPLASGSDAPPIVLVHAAGGTVFPYFGLARLLASASGRAVWGLQATGSSRRSIVELAEGYVTELESLTGTGPGLLAGWSMGGVIAFEMARCLAERARRVPRLALIDPTDPARLGELAEVSEQALIGAFARDLAGLGGAVEGDEGEIQATLEGRPIAEALASLLEVARQRGLVPASTDGSRLRDLFDLFRGHVEALAGYRPRPRDGELDLFLAEGDREDRAAAWRALVKGGVEVHEVPGDHFGLLREPVVELLAARLGACLLPLDGAAAGPTGGFDGGHRR